MKKLVLEYNKVKSRSKDSDINLFHKFYTEKKIVFPWLKKETLRWHTRRSETDRSSSSTTNSSTKPKQKLASLITKQRQVRT